MKNMTFYLTDAEVEKAIKDAVESADADMLATFAGLLLGGKCFYNQKIDKYEFETIPTQYSGAFGMSEE